MRIGIVVHCVTFHKFAHFFEEIDEQSILRLPSNDTAPAASLIALGLIEEGHFVRIFTEGPCNMIFRSDRIEIFIVKKTSRYYKAAGLLSFEQAKRLRGIIKDNYRDLDVLHAHWSYENALACLPFAKQIPTFCTVRDWYTTIMSYKKKDSFFSRIYWKLRGRINEKVFSCDDIHFIANSSYMEELIEKKIAKKVPILINPVDSKNIKKEGKKYPSNLRIVTITSGMGERKNITTLLKAYKLIKKTYCDAELTYIVGTLRENAEQTTLYNLWKEQNLLDGVNMMYHLTHDEIYNIIDSCTMLVHPSFEESFGNTIIESMIRKTSVVAGEKSGAVPILLQNGKLGYLCDISSDIILADTIKYVYQHPEEAQAKVVAASEWVYSNTEREIAKQHVKYFEKYCSK